MGRLVPLLAFDGVAGNVGSGAILDAVNLAVVPRDATTRPAAVSSRERAGSLLRLARTLAQLRRWGAARYNVPVAGDASVYANPERLAALRSTGLLDSLPEESFDRLTRLAAAALDVPVSLCSLLDEDRHFFKSCVGLPAPYAEIRERPLSASFCQYAAALRQPLIIEDATSDPRVADNPATLEFGIGGYLGIPLITSDGFAVGTFCVIDTRPRKWTDAQVAIARAIAGCAVSEIDARRAAQEARLRSAILEAQTEATIDGILVVGPADEILSFNRRFVELWGLSQDVVASRSDRAALQAVEALLAEPGEFYERVRHLYAHPDEEDRAEIRLKDGRFLDRFSAPLREADGGCRGRVWVFRDVTAEKRAERLLAGQKRILERIATGTPLATTLHEICALIDDLAPDVLSSILLADENGRRLRHGAAPRLPRDYTDALDGLAIGPAAGSCGTAAYRQARVVVTDLTEDPLWAGYRHLAAAAGLRACWSTPVIGSDGRVLGTFALYHRSPRTPGPGDWQLVDGAVYLASIAIERERAEAERTRLLANERAARAEAEKANQMKDQFLATLSHELRTPLNAILGWSRMLSLGTLPEPARDRALQSIDRNARAQAELIEHLLDLSRIAAGKLRLELRPIEVNGLVGCAVDAIRSTADMRGIGIVTEIASGVGPVLGDADRLQQVIWNLLSNAVKFTPEGGTVRVAVRRQGGGASIEVSDNGIGIPADVLPHVFDPFRQADSTTTRQYGGLGLGLAIVRHLVELHNGQVTAESGGAGRGAAFRVWLPAIAASDAEFVQPAAAAPALSAEEGWTLSGRRVLLVDDDADAGDVLAAAFGPTGAETRVARSAREAISLIDSWRPDALVSDIAMPGQDGYSVVQWWRDADREHGTSRPAVALSGFAAVRDRVRSLDLGFDVHLAKPADPVEVVRTVARLLRPPSGLSVGLLGRPQGGRDSRSRDSI